MSLIHANILDTLSTPLPSALSKVIYSPFNYDGFLNYRTAILPKNKYIWGPGNWDFGRLPANISIFDFLLYQGEMFKAWLSDQGYVGEEIIFCPSFPDFQMSIETQTVGTTADSPHNKIPFTICYEISRHEPDSGGQYPFQGSKKDWKTNDIGEFRDPDTGLTFNMRMRQWETMVEYTCIARSGLEAEWLTKLFEDFCDDAEAKFLEAGVEKTVPLGRFRREVTKLDTAGANYRTTARWFRTEEFKIFGPLQTITGVDIELRNPDIPDMTDDSNTVVPIPKLTDVVLERVISGDTLQVLLSGKSQTVKLISLTAPELSMNDVAIAQAKKYGITPGTLVERGQLALTFLQSLISVGDTLTLEFDTVECDTSGRVLAYVYSGVTFLNEVMLKGGYAWQTPSLVNTRYNSTFSLISKMKG